ncbi:MAG: hypothetical protein ACLFV4_04740 [Candidatus Hydrogenedentota bacterium]
MRKVMYITTAAALALFIGAGAYAEHAIPEDQIDNQKIYLGNPADFEKAGEIDFMEVVKATPEYKDIQRKNIDQGTGEYWIGMDRASARAENAVVSVTEEEDYDLVTKKGYLAEVDEDIPVEDITGEVVSTIEEE